MTLLVVGAPPEYRTWLGELPPRIRLVSSAKGTLAAAHLFVTKRADLKEQLTALRGRIDQSGFVWVSWPKKASKVPTEVTENTIREVALPLGFVDVKVCAVSDIWSGLKLVIRKELRQA